MSLAAQLDQAVRAVCPISGVSIGDTNDKATWVVHFAIEATAQQRADAAAVVAGFVYVAPDPANFDLMEKTFKAIGLLLRQYTNQLKAGTYVNKSIADLKADFKAIFDALP